MKNKKIMYLIIAIAVIVVSIIVILTVNALTDRQSPGNTGGNIASLRFNVLEEPVKAVDITFRDMDGNQYTLEDFSDKHLIVNFWAVFCGPCVDELPDFDKAVDELRKNDIELIAINIVEPEDEVRSFIDNMELGKLGFYMDIDGNSAYTYSVQTIPRTLVINNEGYIVAAAAGAVTYDDLMAVAELLD